MSLRDEAEINAAFKAARALEDAGDYDAAFAAFAEANAARHATLDVQAYLSRHAMMAENLEWLFTPDVMARWRRGGDRTTAPIFIVGLPRSGSTLIEQVLASHSKVTGLGETDTFSPMALKRFPFPSKPPAKDHFARLAHDYLAAVRALGWRDTPRFTDKWLGNYMMIGSIHLALPRATIIHTVRDPIDTCLSSWRLNFVADNNAYVYSLAEIGQTYVRYRRIMDFWNRLLPGRILEVRHEDFVRDFPASARRLLHACGLGWEPACERFHETERTVLTASAEQVRRPIFTDSIGRWRAYEAHLGPLIEALGPYARS